jgi:RimJ/RimL family protein N-acetyltransferase
MVTAKCWVSNIPLIHAFERNGFLLMDTAVDVVRERAGADGKQSINPAQPEGFVLRSATREDIAALRDLATKAFAHHFGRFHSDPRIGRVRGAGVYAAWIAACVEGWADFVFLAEEVPTRAVAGFSAWKKPSKQALSLDLALAHYSIGAVSPDFSGRGLFKSLTLAGMEALGTGVAIEGPTHLHNLAVQRGYLALGWKIADSRHTFHAWLE